MQYTIERPAGPRQLEAAQLHEAIRIESRICAYDIPDWTDEELRYWWIEDTAPGPDGLYRVTRPARISDREKERRKIAEGTNLFTNVGLIQLVANMGAQSQGGMQTWGGILSLGNGAVPSLPTRQDTTVWGDGFTTGSRKVPAATTVSGLTGTLTCNFQSGDAVGTITNSGLYGFMFGLPGHLNSPATTTPGSGQLNSHLLFSFVKGASAVAVAYSMTLSNPTH